jgi:hypothetical protein
VRSATDAKSGSICRLRGRCVTGGFVRESVLRLLVSGFPFPLSVQFAIWASDGRGLLASTKSILK